jgi:hypothetical protein
MKKIAHLTFASAIVLTGCVPITSSLNINPATGVAKWSSPKDVTVEEIDAYIATNGERHLVVKNWRSSNNPQVIDAKGQADVAIAKQWGDNLINAVGAGASLATTMGTQAAASKLASGVASALVKPNAVAPVSVPTVITNTPQ